jgi:DnaK suppressor protein
MNENELALFRRMIGEQLNELANEDRLGRDAQKIVALDQQSVGRLSRMDALQNQAMAKAAQARRDMQARRLEAALARIDAGEFGYCEDCGEDIAPKRLELDPAATKCISCAAG